MSDGVMGGVPPAELPALSRFSRPDLQVENSPLVTPSPPAPTPPARTREPRTRGRGRSGRRAAGSKGKSFPCPICRKVFSQKGNMKMHQRVHTGEKPFECPVCHKRFSQKGNMQTHRRIHSGVKPFECVECKQQFRQKSKLIKHMRSHVAQQREREKKKEKQQQQGGNREPPAASSGAATPPTMGSEDIKLNQLLSKTPRLLNQPLDIQLIPGFAVSGVSATPEFPPQLAPGSAPVSQPPPYQSLPPDLEPYSETVPTTSPAPERKQPEAVVVVPSSEGVHTRPPAGNKREVMHDGSRRRVLGRTPKRMKLPRGDNPGILGGGVDPAVGSSTSVPTPSLTTPTRASGDASSRPAIPLVGDARVGDAIVEDATPDADISATLMSVLSGRGLPNTTDRAQADDLGSPSFGAALSEPEPIMPSIGQTKHSIES